MSSVASTPASTPAPSIRPDTSDDESAVDGTKRKRVSYVWSHFTKIKGAKRGDGYNQCEVLEPKTGRACGSKMKEDATGSTKSMAAHLRSKHRIYEDGPAKRQYESSVVGYFKKSKIGNAVSLEFFLFHLI